LTLGTEPGAVVERGLEAAEIGVRHMRGAACVANRSTPRSNAVVARGVA
jgi:hypothetical protein